jgi:hypothetical protein
LLQYNPDDLVQVQLDDFFKLHLSECLDSECPCLLLEDLSCPISQSSDPIVLHL